MFNKIQQWLTRPYLWLVLSSIVLMLPLFLLGEPGLYGDDVNAYQAMEALSLEGAIAHWLNEYGWSYRPVGITLLYIYYALFPENSFLLYLGYQLCYLILSLVLCREVFKLTGSVSAGTFVALFFLFFPFNPTVYWQISSFMMVFATLFTVVIIRPLLNAAIQQSYGIFFLLSVAWLLLLFSYEQLLGLAAVIGLLIIFAVYSSNWKEVVKKIIVPLMILGIISLIFLVSYLSSDSNPKLVSLKSVNGNVSIASQEKIALGGTFESDVLDSLSLDGSSSIDIFPADLDVRVFAKEYNDIVQKKVSVNKVISGRLWSFLGRLGRGVKFLSDSIIYSFNSLIMAGASGYIMMSAILMLGFCVFFIPNLVPSMNNQTAWLCLVIGGLWVVVTLAPFFVYNKVNIPPYTLMLPSIGLGVAAFGFFILWLSFFSELYIKWIIKILLFFSIISLSLIQYGYYAGLKEELNHWQNVAGKVQQKEILRYRNAVIVSGVEEKINTHIFWLERAVGLRYLSIQLNQNVLQVVHNGNKLLLILDSN